MDKNNQVCLVDITEKTKSNKNLEKFLIGNEITLCKKIQNNICCSKILPIKDDIIVICVKSSDVKYKLDEKEENYYIILFRVKRRIFDFGEVFGYGKIYYEMQFEDIEI